LGLDPARHHRALLSRGADGARRRHAGAAHVRHAQAREQRLGAQRADAVRLRLLARGVGGVLHRLRDQDPDLPAAHLAAGCARRGADGGVGDPRRRAAQDGRLRHPARELRDAARGDRVGGDDDDRARRHQHRVRRAVRLRADRSEAAGRVLVGEPHGLLPRRHGLVHRRGDERRDAADVQPRHDHGDAVPARRRPLRSRAHAADRPFRRAGRCDAALCLRARPRVLRVARAAGAVRLRRRAAGVPRRLRGASRGGGDRALRRGHHGGVSLVGAAAGAARTLERGVARSRAVFRSDRAREADAGAAGGVRHRARRVADAAVAARRAGARRAGPPRARLMLDNAHSLAAFAPELVLAATVLVVLAADLAVGRLRIGAVAVLSLVGVAAAAWATLATAGAPRGLFFGLVARDPYGDFFKLLFLMTAALVALVALRAGDAVEESAAELYALLLTTTLGMMLMAAARDLLMAYLSLETVSIMSYVLAGFRRRARASAEAALKYVVYGGVASGVMLYGMSLFYGLAGATSFPAILQAAGSTTAAPTVVLAVVLCLAGFGYKVASVPFHMWCPDVYEGAPTVVSAFLAVGPKAAGFALLLRFCAGVLPAELGGAPAPWPLLFGLVAVATMTLGNLAALAQTNVKRLLAYSSIAHAGYLLLAIVAGGRDGVRALLLYLVAYVFMTLGAFVVVIAVAERGVG